MIWSLPYGRQCSEWTKDVYRPLSWEDSKEIAPFRGNVYKTKVTDADGYVSEKE